MTMNHFFQKLMQPILLIAKNNGINLSSADITNPNHQYNVNSVWHIFILAVLTPQMTSLIKQSKD